MFQTLTIGAPALKNIFSRAIEFRLPKATDAHVRGKQALRSVVCEVPAKPQWCEIRNTVFSWTQSQFPFRVRSGRKLKIAQPLIIRVIGKAFFDIGHAPADQSNRRRDLQGYAAWEIHPVMKLTVQ
jgi:hypothetical protein